MMNFYWHFVNPNTTTLYVLSAFEQHRCSPYHLLGLNLCNGETSCPFEISPLIQRFEDGAFSQQDKVLPLMVKLYL